eukprot:35882-Rhodomonas_salina.2
MRGRKEGGERGRSVRVGGVRAVACKRGAGAREAGSGDGGRDCCPSTCCAGIAFTWVEHRVQIRVRAFALERREIQCEIKHKKTAFLAGYLAEIRSRSNSPCMLPGSSIAHVSTGLPVPQAKHNSHSMRRTVANSMRRTVVNRGQRQYRASHTEHVAR